MPLRLLQLPEQEGRPSLPAQRTVDVPGRGPMCLRESGAADGMPLLLMHPWTWTADIAFGEAIDSLAIGHRVIAVDLRGHGRSARVDGPVSLDDFVDDVLGLMDYLGLERAVLVGHSLGGVVAMATALRARHRVAGLVIVAAAACYRVSWRDRVLWWALRSLRPLAVRDIGGSLPLRYFLVSAAADAGVLRRWRWLEHELGRNTVRAMWEVGAMVSALDLRPALAGARLDIPTAYVVLGRDTVCAPFLQRATAAVLRATVVELDADHDVPVVSPELYRRVLIQALELVGELGPSPRA